MKDQTVRRMAEAIFAKAPSGWTQGALYGQAGPRSTSTTGAYTPRPEGWGHMVPSSHEELRALAEALREDRGWENVAVEVRCRPSGAYQCVAFHDAVIRVSGGTDGFDMVLDPAYRLPQPGEHQEPGTAAPAGDPELAAARFRTYLERRAAILGRPDKLPPPASEAAIEKAERRLGRRLPADLRALYAIADGDDYGSIFHGNAWLSLENLVTASTARGARERPWYDWDLEWDAVVFDTVPTDTVRRCGDHPCWLRFGTSEDGNFLAVDTAPAREGHTGQVIQTGRDYDRGPAYVADSVTSLLGHYLEQLEQGEYESVGDHLQVHGPCAPGPEEIVGGIPDEVPPSLQAIHINDADGLVDLTPLTAARHLRRLHLNRSTAAGLTPVRELPVESLRIGLDHGDLTPLEGHPHLAALDLTTTAPTDLAPLRTVPRLRGLDLSAAPDLRGLTALADLPELRFLALTGRQWAALLDEGAAPPALAAARLTDDASSLDDALALASRLGLDTENPVRIAGTIPLAGG